MRANQTRYNLHYHIVFSTKNRVACLKEEDIDKIRELACSKAQEIGSSIRILNGIGSCSYPDVHPSEIKHFLCGDAYQGLCIL
ncbi:MAG: transposase [Leptospiraceae bacterium]|nr:transposase [Leptospiraceae bacterium]MCP5501822.1 transposase [Leptospiraceae bacterium]